MDALRSRVERIVREVIGEFLAASGELRSNTGADPRSRPLIAANWKMNLLSADARAFAARLVPVEGADILLCPPAILLPVLRGALGPTSRVSLGAQNLHHQPKGAFTGEHSAAMIRDAGASFVVLGHSERRWIFGETDEEISTKVQAALAASLIPILCIGERLEERESGSTFRVLRNQLTGSLAAIPFPLPDPSELVIAYEPVWAIGTGRTATPAQANEAIEFTRDVLAEKFGWGFARRVRLLYGGSVTAKNAAELALEPEIDGFLVGGASLCADNLGAIARAAAGVAKKTEASPK